MLKVFDKVIDPSKCSPITFNFVDVEEDTWNSMINEMSAEEACHILNKKISND